MAGSCCAKPITTIIRVAEFEAGIIGLDQALRNVYVSGLGGEEEIQRDLLKWIKEFGNYITPSREGDYRKALLREYRVYLKTLAQEGKKVGERLYKR
jgi:hypothetical protein